MAKDERSSKSRIVSRSPIARTSTATRLAASVVAISLLSLGAATIVGVTTGERLAEDLNSERIRATVEAAAWDVGAELSSLERTASSLSSSRQAGVAVRAFDEALTELEASFDASDFGDELEELFTLFQSDYIEPLRETGRDIQLRDIVGRSEVAGYLQYEYTVDLGPLGRPSTLDDAGDGTTWTNVHRQVHPVYRDVVNRLGLVDLLLVENGGTVVYSVNKRPDLGTNLRTGPFSGSVLANTYRRVVDDPDTAFASSDLGFYDAAPGAVVGVVGSPIETDGLTGALLLTYDASRFVDLVSADETWEAGGLPDTADVYVVGSDARTRSDPRAFLDTPSTYLDAAIAAGALTEAERVEIEARGTTVLTQLVPDEIVDAGREGDTSANAIASITGGSVLSVTVPARTESVEWFVVAQVDDAAASRGLDDFQELLIVGAAIFVVVLAFLAVAWANSLVRSVRHISDRISRQGRLEGDIVVPPQTPIEIQRLAGQLGVMREALTEQQQQISAARRERLGLLRSLLPPSVADRMASGDLHALEQVGSTSVIVVVVLGLSDLVRDSSGSADREVIDHLVTQLDEVAAVHGCDRIKVVGDAYYAACGHDRPFIDHAPRSIAFALDAIDAVEALDIDADLELAIGVHSGPVTTGTAGGASLVYDVWGLTVGTAHVLARTARAGEVRTSAETSALLPDKYLVEPSEDDGQLLVTEQDVDEVVAP
ncbi:MAG: adenylate/guanylate cyclase domain-containing protein [Ilumatobacter sp.]